MEGGTQKLTSSIGALVTATTRDGESAVEAKPLEMPESDAKDETTSKD
jgi:hypothetical protein